MKRNIIVDLSPLRHGYCGLWEYAYQFAKHLMELYNPDEFDLSFLVPKKHPLIAQKNVKFVTTSIFKRHCKIWTHKYDLYHDLSFPSPYLPSKKYKGIIISTLHDLNFLYEKSEKRGKQYLSNYQEALSKIDQLIFISQFTANEAKKFLQFNIPTTIIYNGVNQNHSYIQEKLIQEPFLFSLSTMMRKKNLHTLIPMMTLLPHYKLLIAGKIIHKSYYDELLLMVKKYKLTDRIQFIGEIDETYKESLYANCTAFLFPSLIEGFGIPPIEAMSYGKPIFVSDRTSVPEICGPLAFYWKSFEPSYMAECFISGINIYKSNIAYKDQLKQYAKKYDWNDNVIKHIELYRTRLKRI